MTSPRARLSHCGRASVALAVAHARYWPTVAPRVRRELRRWDRHAQAIADPVLRGHALRKLHDERANTEALASLCTLAPRRNRPAAIRATVALQVIYDYLDSVTEERVEDPLRSSRQLFRSVTVALTPGMRAEDYYRHHPWRDDRGYIDALVATCREAVTALPAAASVLPVARAAAERFAEAQVRSHAVPWLGREQLRRWARPRSVSLDLAWWEWAGGAAASVFCIHALLAAAADPRTTPAQAAAIDRAYLLQSTLATMLDSVVDDERDLRQGAHRYIAYYPDTSVAAREVASIAERAVAAARELPHGAHHVMTVAGVTAYYVSARAARGFPACVVARSVVRELRPTVLPALAIFRLWRALRGRSVW